MTVQNHTDVHDHLLYALSTDYGRRQIILHTICPSGGSEQFIDVVFTDVVTCHLEQAAFGADSSNVLFGVEETDPRAIFEQDSVGTWCSARLLEHTKNHGWPILGYSDLDDLVRQLTAENAKAYEVHGTCGLSGFIFARLLEYRVRSSRYQGPA